MKSTLKKQVADLQKELQELRSNTNKLQVKVSAYLVPRLQKMDRELIELKNWRDRQKQTNEIFFDQFREFVSCMRGIVSPDEAMELYNDMISKFLKLSERLQVGGGKTQ